MRKINFANWLFSFVQFKLVRKLSELNSTTIVKIILKLPSKWTNTIISSTYIYIVIAPYQLFKIIITPYTPFACFNSCQRTTTTTTKPSALEGLTHKHQQFLCLISFEFGFWWNYDTVTRTPQCTIYCAVCIINCINSSRCIISIIFVCVCFFNI